jgi:hypothetical protein
MLGAVNALLRSPAERQRAAFWDAIAERQAASARACLN